MNLIETFSNSIMYIIIGLGIIGFIAPLIMGLIVENNRLLRESRTHKPIEEQKQEIKEKVIIGTVIFVSIFFGSLLLVGAVAAWFKLCGIIISLVF
jgi:hypothetical protein